MGGNVISLTIAEFQSVVANRHSVFSTAGITLKDLEAWRLAGSPVSSKELSVASLREVRRIYGKALPSSRVIDVEAVRLLPTYQARLEALVGLDLASVGFYQDGHPLNKGLFGHTVEYILGLARNSTPEPDTVEGEIKTTKVNSFGKVIEDLALGTFVPNSLTSQSAQDMLTLGDLQQTHLYKKIKNIFIIGVLPVKGGGGRVLFSEKFSLPDYPEYLQACIKDYALIASRFKEQQATGQDMSGAELSAGTQVLTVKPKSQKGGTSYAFYFRQKAVNRLLSLRAE